MALKSFSYLTGSLDDTAFLDLTDRNLPRQKTLPKFCNMTKKVNYICILCIEYMYADRLKGLLYDQRSRVKGGD